MIHYSTKYNSSHAYAVNHNADCNAVLLKTQDDTDQARIILNIHEAEHMISLLRDAIEKVKQKQNSVADNGWIGVDLDGTLAKYNYGDLHRHGVTYIGEPIISMVNRVKLWLSEGRKVKIFTARIAADHPGEKDDIINAIDVWCKEHIGQKLEITNIKDYNMIALYDDRAFNVVPNTGIVVGIDK